MNIIGASDQPTPNEIKAPKPQYVHCGADILLNGAVQDLEGESRCIVCGRSTKIKILHGQISQLEPPEAVLHVVEYQTGPQSTAIVCEGSPIFDRDSCLQTWLKSYRGLPGKVFKPQEYMPRASQLAAERVGHAAVRSGSIGSPVDFAENAGVIRCADCHCSPIECRESQSAIGCPRCSLESCCCWTPSGVA